MQLLIKCTIFKRKKSHEMSFLSQGVMGELYYCSPTDSHDTLHLSTRRGNRGVISWLFPDEIRLVIFWKESLTVTFPECNQSNSRQALWKHSWFCLGDMVGDIHEIVWGISLETFLNLSEEWVWRHSWIGLVKQSGNSHEFAWKVSWEFFHYLRMFSSL